MENENAKVAQDGRFRVQVHDDTSVSLENCVLKLGTPLRHLLVQLAEAEEKLGRPTVRCTEEGNMSSPLEVWLEGIGTRLKIDPVRHILKEIVLHDVPTVSREGTENGDTIRSLEYYDSWDGDRDEDRDEVLDQDDTEETGLVVLPDDDEDNFQIPDSLYHDGLCTLSRVWAKIGPEGVFLSFHLSQGDGNNLKKETVKFFLGDTRENVEDVLGKCEPVVFDNLYLMNYNHVGLAFVMDKKDTIVCFRLFSGLPGHPTFGVFERCPWRLEFQASPKARCRSVSYKSPLKDFTQFPLRQVWPKDGGSGSADPNIGYFRVLGAVVLSVDKRYEGVGSVTLFKEGDERINEFWGNTAL